MDEKNIKELLKEEIVSDFENLNELEIGSKERSMAVSDLVKLYNLAIEESKVEQELKIKKAESKRQLNNQENEICLKQKQFELDCEIKRNSSENSKLELKGQKIDRYVKLGIAVAELILPMMFYAVWMKRGFDFEKTGTFTSTTFRGLFSHFKPTKKSK